MIGLLIGKHVFMPDEYISSDKRTIPALWMLL